jgi:phage-related protein
MMSHHDCSLRGFHLLQIVTQCISIYLLLRIWRVNHSIPDILREVPREFSGLSPGTFSVIHSIFADRATIQNRGSNLMEKVIDGDILTNGG